MSASLVMPLSEKTIAQLRAGDRVTLSGAVYAACGPAYRQLVDAVRQGGRLPVDLDGQVICFLERPLTDDGAPLEVSLCNTPGVEWYVPPLLAEGVRGIIGQRGDSAAMKYTYRKYRAVHFSPESDITRHVQSSRVAIHGGQDAIHLLTLQDFPVAVASDVYGGETNE